MDRVCEEEAERDDKSFIARGEGRAGGRPIPKPAIEVFSIAGVPVLELRPLEVDGLDPPRLTDGDSLIALNLRPNSLEGVPSLELKAENLDIGCDVSPKDRCRSGLRDERLPTIAGRLDEAILGGPMTSPPVSGFVDKISCRLSSA